MPQIAAYHNKLKVEAGCEEGVMIVRERVVGVTKAHGEGYVALSELTAEGE